MKSAGSSGVGTISGSIQTTKHTGITKTGSSSKSTSGSGSGSGSGSSSSSSSTNTGSSSGSHQISLGLATKSLLVGAVSIFGFGLIFA